MNDKIQELIDLTLGDDGYISPKETDFIIRKAKELGEDPEEVLMCINVANAKAERANQEERQKAKGMSCPWCNMTIPELSEECPYCHKKITARASQELEEILDNLENALVDLKAGKDIAKSKAVVERFTRKAQLKYSENPKIKNLIADIETETVAAEKRALDEREEAARLLRKHQKAEMKAKRNETIFSVIKANKKLVGIGALILLIAIIWGIKRFTSGPDYANDPKVCTEAINDAIEAGNLKNAEALYSTYYHEHGIHGIEPAIENIAKAYIEKGDLEKALSYGKHLDGFQDDGPIIPLVEQKYIEKGDYDKAENCHDYWGRPREYFDFLCKCIDNLKEKGDNSKIKSFIERKASFFNSRLSNDEEWQNAAVKKRLYEYAGI